MSTKRSRSDTDRSAIRDFEDDTEGNSFCKKKISLTATICLVGKYIYSPNRRKEYKVFRGGVVRKRWR